MFTFYYKNEDSTHYDPVSKEMKNTTAHMNDLMQVELGKITSEDIHKEEKILLAEHSVGSKVFNEKVKEYKEFKAGDNLSEYLLKPENILEYMRNVAITEFALYELMRTGVLMPTGIKRSPLDMQIDIRHSDGNRIIHAIIDLMPFSEFIVMPMK